MNYVQVLHDLQNNIHSDIVQEATVRNMINGNDSDGVLRLNEPIYGIHAVCCETGVLISGNGVVLRYNTFSIEQLAEIHNVLVFKKEYTFVSQHEYSV